ncbi:MAG: PepSY domain-containing protein [Planctomycetota bacterium]
MNTSHSIYLPAILVMAALMCVWPQPVLADENEQEEIVTLEQLPPVVRKTLHRESTGGTIGEIEKETKHGRVIYEAEVMLDGREYEVKIAANGILIKKELEEQEKHKKQAQSNVWSFEKNEVGSVPKGWKVAETRGKGKTATWKVISDGAESKKAVAITENKNSGSTYNLLIAKETNYKDLEIELKVKSMTGKEDQGGGPIWRAKDADNYYIARWNPLEKNFRVYYVKDGRRKQLASADIETDSGKWHEIEIKHVGNKIVAEFDDEKVIEIEDSTFAEGGMVGLWTKADAATAFDDFEVETEEEDSD